VAAACASNTDLLITHHPLTLSPYKTIDFETPLGAIIQQAAQNRLAIFSAHTNLDSARGGLNDLLASRLSLKNQTRLLPAETHDDCKLVVYAPIEHEKAVLRALLEAGAGTIGGYTSCSFRNQGTGTFKPGLEAQPYSGVHGTLSQADEVRSEALVQKKQLSHVISHVRGHHPYETMAYDIYPLVSIESSEGLGCIGDFEDPIELQPLALQIKEMMGLQTVRLAGRPDLKVERAAVCSGSGASLLPLFLATEAQVFISGDWRYHDARQVEASNRGLIDIGHFASEHIIVKDLTRRLLNELEEAGLSVTVEACELEKDPFHTV
jgi:dinuclear metal center YbgI/SA1388 family protein